MRWVILIELSFKWHSGNQGVTMKFDGVYNNLKTQRKSGQPNQSVFETTLEYFLSRKQREGVQVCRVLEGGGTLQKMAWSQQTTRKGKSGRGKVQKRSDTSYTTSSNARVNIDLNEEEDELELNEVVRPIGRDKAKREGSSSSETRTKKSDEFLKMASEFEKYNLNFSTRMQFEREKLEKNEQVWQNKLKDREEKQCTWDMVVWQQITKTNVRTWTRLDLLRKSKDNNIIISFTFFLAFFFPFVRVMWLVWQSSYYCRVRSDYGIGYDVV